MKKQNIRTISLIVCTFTYLLVGAAVFDALESETEKKRWEVLQTIENMIIRKYDISADDFKVMETIVLKSEPHKAGQQWKFTGAFYYATTVLTTIGYGHSTPTTIGGKLFTMCYAMIGIPLGLVMFQSIGERVNQFSSFVIRLVKRSLNCRQHQATELDLICVITTLSSLTIAGGAGAFSKFEGWSYFDSVYYCFITLTTIGFGDMVALQKDNALNRKPEYVMFALIFILFGLAIVAACLNLLVLRFVTMNTEDERRDEAQAMQALQVASNVRLEGDVITANGVINPFYFDERAEKTSLLNGNSDEPFDDRKFAIMVNCTRSSTNLMASTPDSDLMNHFEMTTSPNIMAMNRAASSSAPVSTRAGNEVGNDDDEYGGGGGSGRFQFLRQWFIGGGVITHQADSLSPSFDDDDDGFVDDGVDLRLDCDDIRGPTNGAGYRYAADDLNAAIEVQRDLDSRLIGFRGTHSVGNENSNKPLRIQPAANTPESVAAGQCCCACFKAPESGVEKIQTRRRQRRTSSVGQGSGWSGSLVSDCNNRELASEFRANAGKEVYMKR